MSANHKMKIFALVALGFGLPACAMATGNPNFNGYYGGLGIGVLQTNAQISSSTSATYSNTIAEVNELALSQSNVNLYGHNGTAAIYLGFGHFFGDSNFYWAAEIFGNWASRKKTLNNWAFHADPFVADDFESITTATTVKLQSGEWGIDLRPGFLFDTNTMVYGRIGVAFNRLNTTTTNDFSFTNNPNPENPFEITDTYLTSLNQSKKKSVTSLRLGVGIEHLITDNLAVTADYIYTYYGKVSTSGLADVTSAGEDTPDPTIFVTTDGLVADSSGKMGTQVAMIGLKYYFYPVC